MFILGFLATGKKPIKVHFAHNIRANIERQMKMECSIWSMNGESSLNQLVERKFNEIINEMDTWKSFWVKNWEE